MMVVVDYNYYSRERIYNILLGLTSHSLFSLLSLKKLVERQRRIFFVCIIHSYIKFCVSDFL